MIERRRFYFKHTKATRIVVIQILPPRIIRRARKRAREARARKGRAS